MSMDETRPTGQDQRHRVIVIGAGFAGLSATKALAGADVNVLLIDRQNHHLFQPLLYQVATAGLSPADIASPIRSILRRQDNAHVMLAEVTGIDPVKRLVFADGQQLPFDTLVVATGARHAYFGREDWARHAPGLKTIDDATALRHKILLAFERAESEPSSEERRRLQTFVVIGGGPTGVELAGAIAELAKRAMAADFRRIDPRKTRVILVESGERVLTPFDPKLSERAKVSLEKLGVDVRLRRPVEACDEDGVIIGEHRIESRTIIWAAGVKASAAGQWLSADTDRNNRVKVAADLTLPGHPDIFVIGDTAHAQSPDGRPLPGIAPVAKQQGEYVGRSITARLAGQVPPPFSYHDRGTLATIGRKSAIVQMGGMHLSGATAWFLWCVAHVYFLIGFRNRMSVAVSWLWNYFTFQSGARLITGPLGSHVTGPLHPVPFPPDVQRAPSDPASPSASPP